ncbi:MAG: hypothetical protein K2X55_13015 [Burkholderiaceae bacterium]|nr:hypothetical protein [Burkholderiaceae bacterium]
MLEDDKDSRIAALEAALRESIDYLKRLPVVPATSELIASLEAKLAASAPACALHGTRVSASGVVIVEVTVLDNVAVVRTGAPANKADRLQEVLSEGVTVALERS